MTGWTVDDKLAEIRRELRMRETVYPRWIEDKKLSQAVADKRTGILRAIAEDYERLADETKLPFDKKEST